MEAAGLLREHWRKSSMWSMLLRKHAQAVVDDSEVQPQRLHCITKAATCLAWACRLRLRAGVARWV